MSLELTVRQHLQEQTESLSCDLSDALKKLVEDRGGMPRGLIAVAVLGLACSIMTDENGEHGGAIGNLALDSVINAASLLVEATVRGRVAQLEGMFNEGNTGRANNG